MPVFQGQISEEDLLQLIVYIKSLSMPPSPPRHPRATANGQAMRHHMSTTFRIR